MNNKTSKPFFVKLFDFFKSKLFRNIVVVTLLILSLVCMVLMDTGNVFRRRYLPFLESNFIKDLFAWLGIKTFNVGREPWYIFFCAFIIVVMFFVCSIYAKRFLTPIIERNKEKFKDEKKAKRTYYFRFYLVLFLVSLAIIGAFYLFGAFRYFDPETPGILLNLLYSLLITAAFVFILPIAYVVLWVALKVLTFIIAFIIESVVAFIIALKDYRNYQPLHERKGGSGGGGASNDESKIVVDVDLFGKKKKAIDPNDMFPSLTSIDIDYEEEGIPETVSTEISLEELVLQFQSFAINHHKIYYNLPMLRSFLAGMSVSRLLILEGLSGTGKSMLPRMFTEFTKAKRFFAPVQATWRDKSDMLGFYSEFTKTFKTTDFLINLYDAAYIDKMNLMVLDEMNLSRIEYYFADFLSILEYPSEDWKVRVYEPELNQVMPEKLEGGYIRIPTNTWFIGTANTDDSTFIITDKVYDRAITLNFNERIVPIQSNYNSDPIDMKAEDLVKLFEEAQANPKHALTQEDTDKFLKLCDFMSEAFDIRFGNRIMVQINKFVPTYVALGGSKEEALDFIFASKVMRKLQGVYEDYVKDELVKFTKLINSTYGAGVFTQTEALIKKITKRLV